MITEVWFTFQPYHDDDDDVETIKFRDDPNFDGGGDIVFIPHIGEKVGIRPIADNPKSYYLDYVVDVRQYIFKENDRDWKQEVHVMYSSRP